MRNYIVTVTAPYLAGNFMHSVKKLEIPCLISYFYMRISLKKTLKNSVGRPYRRFGVISLPMSMQTVRESVAQKIRLLREVRGLSQQEMTQRLQMTQGGYGKIERAESDLTLSRLHQILTEFGLNLQDFFSLDLTPLGAQSQPTADTYSSNLDGQVHTPSVPGNTKPHLVQVPSTYARDKQPASHNDDHIRMVALQRENALLREIIHLLRTHDPRTQLNLGQ